MPCNVAGDDVKNCTGTARRGADINIIEVGHQQIILVHLEHGTVIKTVNTNVGSFGSTLLGAFSVCQSAVVRFSIGL